MGRRKNLSALGAMPWTRLRLEGNGEFVVREADRSFVRCLYGGEHGGDCILDGRGDVTEQKLFCSRVARGFADLFGWCMKRVELRGGVRWIENHAMKNQQAASFCELYQIGECGRVHVAGKDDAFVPVIDTIGHRRAVAVMRRDGADADAVELGDLALRRF